ncbi:hypothetical protein [Trichormus variabilis]|uniref:hypothetical protein n=1 Tax=Anabaena variabilis TaxID=264691 RepID=UPI00168A821C|nr:hypothetical protein [Trichormus variabilis]
MWISTDDCGYFARKWLKTLPVRENCRKDPRDRLSSTIRGFCCVWQCCPATHTTTKPYQALSITINQLAASRKRF